MAKQINPPLMAGKIIQATKNRESTIKAINYQCIGGKKADMLRPQ